MKFKELEMLDRDDVKLARKVERAGLDTFSQAVKTIYRAEYEDDEDALARVNEWVEKTG